MFLIERPEGFFFFTELWKKIGNIATVNFISENKKIPWTIPSNTFICSDLHDTVLMDDVSDFGHKTLFQESSKLRSD